LVRPDEDHALAITLSAADADGDDLTWIVGDPPHGALTGTAPILTYHPDANYHGSDSFTFQVNDSHLVSNTATANITIASVNDAPGAAGIDDVEWLARTAQAYAIPAFVDPDGDALLYSAKLADGADLPAWLQIDPDSGVLSGTAGNEDVGSYAVVVTAEDGQGGSAVITATLSKAYGDPVTVHYATTNGAALAGSDYSATSGTLSFLPGETSKTFNVTILNDPIVEADEMLTLSLSGAVNASLGSPSSVALTITNDDPSGKIYLPLVMRP
jgi:hypothetical protein